MVRGTKSFHMGAAGRMGGRAGRLVAGLKTPLTPRRAAKGVQSVRGHRACLHFLLSVSEWGVGRGGGGC